jgi:hypothetical protein
VAGGTWFMAVTILGNQFNRSTKTKVRQDAEAFLAGFIEDFLLQNPRFPPPIGRTWGAMVGSWERTACTRVGQEHRLKVVSVNRRYLSSLENKEMDEVTDADLDECRKLYRELNPDALRLGVDPVISLLLHWAKSRRFFIQPKVYIRPQNPPPRVMVAVDYVRPMAKPLPPIVRRGLFGAGPITSRFTAQKRTQATPPGSDQKLFPGTQFPDHTRGHQRLDKVRMVCLSDTHFRHQDIQIPEGDLLVHAGDFTHLGTEQEVIRFGRWLRGLPHPIKIVVSGEHDRFCYENPEKTRTHLGPEVIYLQDQGCEVYGLKIWGSPWHPSAGVRPFGLPRLGEQLRNVWRQIPPETDVLVTHIPSYGLLDSKNPPRLLNGVVVQRIPTPGCELLGRAMSGTRIMVHVFGHIHEGHGDFIHRGRLLLNASLCGEAYRLTHGPTVVDIDPGTRVPSLLH